MDWLVRLVFAITVGYTGIVTAQVSDPQLVGTWTTSSHTVFTGPGFYNVKSDRLQEPKLPGLSYSFTKDGWYEEAYYRTVLNPSNSKCPSGVLQWQHGRYVKNANGSLSLTPISSDGRMLESDPCNSKTGQYSHYSQWEIFKWYEVTMDPYHGVKRLNLYRFDGSPMNTMYLAFSPTPQMLPTQTLKSTNSATGSKAPASTSTAKQKRMLQEILTQPATSRLLDPDQWWWFGASMTAVGAFAYWAF